MIVKDGKRVKCISFEQYGTEGKAPSELIVLKPSQIYRGFSFNFWCNEKLLNFAKK